MAASLFTRSRSKPSLPRARQRTATQATFQRVSHSFQNQEPQMEQNERKGKKTKQEREENTNIPSPLPKRAANPPPARSPKTPPHCLSLPRRPSLSPQRPASTAQNTPHTSPPSRPYSPAKTTPARPHPLAVLAPPLQAAGPGTTRAQGCGSGTPPGRRRQRRASTMAAAR